MQLLPTQQHCLEFRKDFLLHETTVPGYCAQLLAVLLQIQLMMDGQTHDDRKYHASMALHGKIKFERLAVRITLKVTQGHQNCLCL